MATYAFDKRTAIFLAAVCGQTYRCFSRPDGSFQIPGDFTLKAVFEARSFANVKERFGLILESEDSIVVAFRGTGSTVDWVSDVIASQTRYPYVRNAGWTHEGFTNIYRSARAGIMEVLNRLPVRKTLYITGHSLGGALALLCGVDAAANSPHRPFVYTFGAPRVGDPAFAAAFNRRIPSCHRVYNRFDVVPRLPPLLYKSPRTGKVYPYMHVKSGYRLNFRNGSVSANHILGGYFAELAKLDPDYVRELIRRNPDFVPEQVSSGN